MHSFVLISFNYYTKVNILILVIAIINLYYNLIFFNLSEFIITDTELKLIAAAAIIGDNKMPKKGYKIPAAMGTPSTL